MNKITFIRTTVSFLFRRFLGNSSSKGQVDQPHRYQKMSVCESRPQEAGGECAFVFNICSSIGQIFSDLSWAYEFHLDQTFELRMNNFGGILVPILTVYAITEMLLRRFHDKPLLGNKKNSFHLINIFWK